MSTVPVDTTDYPQWVTADPRIRELAEWLHNRDHSRDVHCWARADLDECLGYCFEARQALRFIDEVCA